MVDSLTAVPILRRAGARTLLDLGSGGGYPGLPLAVAVPLDRTLLVDSVAKKAGFLRTVITALGLEDRIEVAAERAERLAADPAHRERWSAVSARAVATLPELLELAFPLLEPSGIMIAWKGAVADDELAEAERALSALGGGSIDVVESSLPDLPDHRLIVVAKRGRTPESFPRDPAARRRRPW